MSGAKARCPSCGTEWDGPVVFCGECGAAVSPAANQARGRGGPPARPAANVGRGNTAAYPRPKEDQRSTHLGISPDAVRAVVAQANTSPADREAKSTRGGPTPATKKNRRGSFPDDALRPADEAPRRTTLTSATGVPDPPKPAPEPAVLAFGAARPTLASAPAPAPPPAPVADERIVSRSTPPADPETARLLEDLDAGFDSIVQPAAAPPPKPAAPAAALHDEAANGPGPAPAAAALHEGAAGGPRPPAPSAPVIEIVHVDHAARAARHEADMAEVRELFAGIAVAYARPLRDFMIEVAWGEPTREWLEVALPATQALKSAASAVELPEVDAALEGYHAALELAMGEPSVTGEVREMLAGAYARLIEAMPNVFSLEGELGKREPIIVRSLLLQVPGVGHVAIEKLYKAGINALEVLYTARAKDLAEATGLDEALAAAICERFQRYRAEVADLGPGKDRAKERAELTALAADLARQHEEHEAAANAWSKDAAARKSRARKERADTLVRIDLLLARMGEVDLQRTIAKVPFHAKVRELYRFLDEANQRVGR